MIKLFFALIGRSVYSIRRVMEASLHPLICRLNMLAYHFNANWEGNSPAFWQTCWKISSVFCNFSFHIEENIVV